MVMPEDVHQYRYFKQKCQRILQILYINLNLNKLYTFISGFLVFNAFLMKTAMFCNSFVLVNFTSC